MLHPNSNSNRVRNTLVIGITLVILAYTAFLFTRPFTQVTLLSVQHIPAAVVQPASPKLDLGAGYWLEDGKIVAPQVNVRPAAASPKLDLGAGYWLEDGKIVAPTVNVKYPVEQVQKIDIGAGYWLILSQHGGKITR